MKTISFFRKFFLIAAVSGLLITSCEKQPSTLDAVSGDVESVSNLKAGNGAASYIIVLNEDFEAAGELIGKRDYDQRKQVMSGYLNRFLGGKGVASNQVEQIYTNVFMGFAARLSGPQLERLLQDPLVKSIEPDQEITLGKPGGGGGTTTGQTIPWGIARVGGGETYTGTGVAWVIDTGIDFTHPDLNVDTDRSSYFIGTSAKDENGHGTHVAGIIAAKNNSIGVVGVAAGAKVVAVRVLDRRGSGTTSSVIAGCDYVKGAAGPNDVANMSLGGGVSTTLDNAVLAMSANVKVALAAGNESDDANNHSPARVNGPNIYTVSAMDSGDKWASFSNYGNPPIDYCAPGVGILSCYKGGAYATMSGTSMAAPHMAGILLLGTISTSGYVIADPDGKPDPIAHH